MGDSIFHQRLKKKRRDAGGERRLVDAARHLQTIAEPDLFDGQETVGQRELVAQRDARERSDVQRAAEEFG